MADLLKTAALYRAVMAASFDPFVTIDSQGIIQAASDSLETVFGWKPEEAVGKNVTILMPEPYRSKHDHYLAQYLRSGRARMLGATRQLESVRKDGSLFPCKISVFQVDMPDGEAPLFAGMLRDITSARLDEQLRLSNHAAELEKRNEDLLSLNLQLEDVRGTLNEALAKADAANKAKTSFLANMSHEIRTPMNAIIGFSRRLLGESLTEDQLRKARFINEAANQLLALLNDVLDISKIEAGRLELCVERMDLHNVARHAVETIKPLAGEKGLAVEFRLDENVPQWVNGDAGRLRQVMLNLLGNAVKFTESGSIQLDVRRESENDETVTVRVEVADSGVGVPKERQDAIFNRFTQADESTTRKYGGTGLGLAICKRLVEIMGGTIGVESEEGDGSTFYFTAVLPKQVSHAADASAPIAAPSRRPEADASATNAPAPRRPRILYAEDSVLNQRLVVEILKCAGMDVSLANDGKEALAALERDSYDLVLMDVQMPEMDGIEATRIIREHETITGRHVPIVALTAFAMSGDRDRCLSSGMDDYATKPINQDELVSKVIHYLEKSNVLAPEPLAACSNEA